jgi:hypothetical protein
LTAHALRPDGTEAAAATASAADYKRLAYIRIGGLPEADGPFTAADAQGSSATSLPPAALRPTAAPVLSHAPSAPKLRTAATAATVAWTPPKNMGDAKVIGYRLTLSDGRTIEVTGRDALVGQPPGQGSCSG